MPHATRKTAIKKENDFVQYMKLVSEIAEDCIIMIAAKDTPWGPAFTPEKTAAMRCIGLQENLYGKFRYAYVAVVSSGEVVFERTGPSTKEVVTCELTIDGDNVSVNSSSYDADVSYVPTAGSIKINGEEFSTKQRGLNIVVYDKTNRTVLDTVNFDTYSENLSCRHPMREAERILSFRELHSNVKMAFVRPPAFPNENLTENEIFILKNNVVRETVINNLDKPVFAIHRYYGRAVLDEVFRVPRSYHDYYGVRHFEDVMGKYVNILGGHRRTMHQPYEKKRTIYIIGGCNAFGIGATDEHTIASFLQEIFNETVPEEGFAVQNYGYFLCEADRKNEEIFTILESLPVKSGDMVLYYCDGVGVPAVSDVPLIDCSKIASRPRDFEVFFDRVHLTPDGYRLVAMKIFEELSEMDLLRGYHKTSEELNLYTAQYGFDSEKGAELIEYKKVLTNFYKEYLSVTIGAIVMNCNPFTLGHRYLIDCALRQCNFLIVFLVEEDKSIFSFEDRLKLVAEGTEDLENVAIIPSGRFIISSLTFEEYFNKSELQECVVDTSMDVTIFAKEIAPCLHITKRFVGEEPFDNVTRQYNEALKSVLPEYGIEVVEIPRKKVEGEEVSASHVRKLLEEQAWDKIRDMVPKTTFDYLVEKDKELHKKN